MKQLTEQLESLVSTCEGETLNLKTDMVKLGEVQTTVTYLIW